MKVNIEPGRVIRLTATVNSSARRGGEYDLDKLRLSKEQQEKILSCEGVTKVAAVKGSKSGQEGDK